MENNYKILKFLKKSWHFISHQNAFIIALELVIFVGIVFAFVGPELMNSKHRIMNNEQLNNNQQLTINNQQLTNVQELKIKEVESNKYAFKTLDGSVIEIGTETHSPPQPYLKINKWDGEVFLKVNMPYNVIGEPRMVEGKLRYTVSKENKELGIMNNELEELSIVSQIKNWLFPFAEGESNQGTMDIDFYPREPEEITETINGEEHTFIQNEQGGVEFDTILYEKPETNVLIFPIETQGLKFYYQPQLTQQEIDEGAFRPENVVGSYAVYHATKGNVHSSQEEADKYKVGKAFHIYRPRIEDSDSWEVWGELNISDRELTVTIPQDFIDNAVYPVVVDPNFGYEDKGDTINSDLNLIKGSVFTTSEPGTGISITAWVNWSFATQIRRHKYAIYKHSDSSFIVGTEEYVIETGSLSPAQEITLNFISQPSLESMTDYVLVGWGGQDEGGTIFFNMYYDDGEGTIQGHHDSETYSNWPEDATFIHEDRKYSIYCTYTSATGGMEQVLFGGAYDLLPTGVSGEYHALAGGLSWSWNEAYRRTLVSTDGVIKNLRVKLSGAPGAGKHYDFTLYVNSAPTALTLEIADAATSNSNMVNEINVTGGDVVSIYCDPDNTPTEVYATWTSVFEGHRAKESLIMGGSANAPSSLGTEYGQAMCTYNNWSNVENAFRQVVPTAGTIKNFYVKLSGDPGTDPDGYRFTVRLNGATDANSPIVTIIADDTTGSDLVHELDVVAGDIITLMSEPLDTPYSTWICWGLTFVADIDGESIMLSTTTDDLDAAATEYQYLTGYEGTPWTANENERYQLGQVCTVKKLHVLLSAAPGTGNDRDFTIRIAGADSNVTLQISDAATTGNSGALTDTVALDEYVTLKTDPISTPDVADAYWGFVCYIVPETGEETTGIGYEGVKLEGVKIE